MLKASTGSSGSTAQFHARPAGLLKPTVLLIHLMTLNSRLAQNFLRAKRLKAMNLFCHWTEKGANRPPVEGISRPYRYLKLWEKRFLGPAILVNIAADKTDNI